jgi:hypothetical protein
MGVVETWKCRTQNETHRFIIILQVKAFEENFAS